MLVPTPDWRHHQGSNLQLILPLPLLREGCAEGSGVTHQVPREGENDPSALVSSLDALKGKKGKLTLRLGRRQSTS